MLAQISKENFFSFRLCRALCSEGPLGVISDKQKFPPFLVLRISGSVCTEKLSVVNRLAMSDDEEQ